MTVSALLFELVSAFVLLPECSALPLNSASLIFAPAFPPTTFVLLLVVVPAVVAPVVYPRSNVFRYNYVKNVGVTPFGTQGFKYVYIQGKQ